ncbi:MAG: SMP-30/gluconolactonase/LRE family protein [Pseudomonadota bacterium]
MSKVQCVANPRAEVGEGPVWDERAQALWWVDIKGQQLFLYDPSTSENRAWTMPERIGCVIPRERPGLIGGFQTGFKWIDPDTGAVSAISDPEPGMPGNRFNDGKCDPKGRLFAGTMDDEENACTGTLYRLDPDLSVHVVRRDVFISNGLGWSPDSSVMYFADSPRRVIWKYDFHTDSGNPTNERVFAQVPDDAGVPDGLCVDAEGYVWSAHWGGWRVTRYAPDGRIDRVLEMPVPQPSSCAFGGSNLSTLYVTSAAIGMTEADLAKAPDGGGLFAVDVGVRGLPVSRFAG